MSLKIQAKTAGRRFVNALPLGVALFCIALVAVGGWVWSFEEQTRWARTLNFQIPELLPLVLDGLALSLAGVAFAAALDGRPAVTARLGTFVAVLSSSASNAAGAWSRSGGNEETVIVASVVPIAANLAFEVFLGELRRQVHRRRGLPAPVAVNGPRMIRLALAPIATTKEWRTYVLKATALPDSSHESDPIGSATDQPAQPAPAPNPDPTGSTPVTPPGVEAPVGSGPKPDPTGATVSNRSTISIGPSMAEVPTRPVPTRRLVDTVPLGRPTGSARPGEGPDGTDRVAGSDNELKAALRAAIKVGQIGRPLTEKSVRSVVVAGGPKARELRDQINEENATDGAKEPEVARG